jgi:hypothetical protein
LRRSKGRKASRKESSKRRNISSNEQETTNKNESDIVNRSRRESGAFSLDRPFSAPIFRKTITRKTI